MATRASMEPRSVERGMAKVCGITRERVRASMEPRSVERGMTTAGYNKNGICYASMEPRSVERGMHHQTSFRICSYRLQWSRVRLNAECRQVLDQRPRPFSLQWSRVRLNAEWMNLWSTNLTIVQASMEPRSVERGMPS